MHSVLAHFDRRVANEVDCERRRRNFQVFLTPAVRIIVVASLHRLVLQRLARGYRFT